MLWVYRSYKYDYSYSAGIDFRRQILTSKFDPRTVRVNNELKRKQDVSAHQITVRGMLDHEMSVLTLENIV